MPDEVTTISGPPVFEVVPEWEQVPDGVSHGDVADVAIGPDDSVYLITRRPPQVVIYDKNGAFIRSWGQDVFSARPHSITVSADGTVYVVDELPHVIYHFTADGRRIGVIGTPGQAGDSGIDTSISDMYDRLASIRRGAPPFNLPTKVAEAPNGELYVTDGYGNCRVHRFSEDGRYLASWGEPGTGPGQFYVPHHVVVTADERVIVCDRENERIQIFTLNGEFMEAWTGLQRPAAIAIDSDNLIYVAELPWRIGGGSFLQGRIATEQHARVSVLDPSGHVLEHWGTPEPCAPGSFVAPHGMAIDSRGDLYVAEVTWSFAGQMGLVPDDCHTLQKFARI